jgi:acetyltransferase
MDYLSEASGEMGSVTPVLFGSGSLLTTRSRFQFSMRPVEDDDASGLRGFYDAVTPDDLRFRFLSSPAKVNPVQVALQPPGDRSVSESYLAFDQVVGCILASATLALDHDRQDAEVAIVIRSALKGRGLGWAILDDVCSRAAALGATTVRTVESREVGSPTLLERELGFTVRRTPEDRTRIVLERVLQPADADTIRPSA